MTDLWLHQSRTNRKTKLRRITNNCTRLFEFHTLRSRVKKLDNYLSLGWNRNIKNYENLIAIFERLWSTLWISVIVPERYGMKLEKFNSTKRKYRWLMQSRMFQIRKITNCNWNVFRKNGERNWHVQLLVYRCKSFLPIFLQYFITIKIDII